MAAIIVEAYRDTYRSCNRCAIVKTKKLRPWPAYKQSGRKNDC